MTKDYVPPPSHPNNNGDDDFSETPVAPVDKAKDGEMLSRI